MIQDSSAARLLARAAFILRLERGARWNLRRAQPVPVEVLGVRGDLRVGGVGR